MRRLLSLLAAVGAVACSELTSTTRVSLLESGNEAQWERWYGLAETCSGVEGDYARWLAQKQVFGVGIADGDPWYSSSQYVIDSTVIVHDALHALLGTIDHPPEYFGISLGKAGWHGGRCGYLMLRKLY